MQDKVCVLNAMCAPNLSFLIMINLKLVCFSTPFYMLELYSANKSSAKFGSLCYYVFSRCAHPMGTILHLGKSCGENKAT